MSLWGLQFAAAISATLVDAIPTVAYPLNSQVPPVARVSEPFSYNLSPSTFFSTLPLTYTLSSGPSWLSLDSKSLRLSGTPSTKDVGPTDVTGVAIGITATDTTGSTNLNSTLVISRNPAPVVKVSPTEQLASFGVFSTPSTLLYHPSTSFSFEFDKGTFSGSGLTYYAVTTDHTPLPAWVLFDSSKLSFSGQTPDYASLIQPPQVFGIRLIASDVEGFAGSFFSFDVEVGVHLLAIVDGNLTIEAAQGEQVNYKGLRDAIQIDGRNARPAELLSVTAKTPSWLEFDDKTLEFHGAAPENVKPYTISVDVKDIYEGVASTQVFIVTSPEITDLFNGKIGNLNITVGSSFRYDLISYLRDPSSTVMEADIPDRLTWLTFNPKTFVLSGDVPDEIKASSIEIGVKATSKSFKASSAQSIKLVVAKTSVKSSHSASKPTLTASVVFSPLSTSNSSISPPPSSNGLNTGAIIAIIVPLSLLLLSILLAMACYFRRRRHAQSRPSSSAAKSENSALDGHQSSVIEIIRPIQPLKIIPPPEPLQLDMSGFGRPTSSVMLSLEDGSAPKRKSQLTTLRQSQTLSAISDPRRSRMLAETITAGNRMRSQSDNALSNTDKAWSYTQGSSRLTQRSSQTNSSHRLTRTYSNYSRKGHVRRSTRILSSKDINKFKERPEAGRPPQSSIVPAAMPAAQTGNSSVQDSSFSFMPIDDFSAQTTQASLMHIAENTQKRQPIMDRPRRPKSTRRQSRLLPNFGVATVAGTGHSRRESISPFRGEIGKRGSVHGQDWIASRSRGGVSRDSKTWLTVATSASTDRQSNTSNYSVYPETPIPTGANVRMSTIRMVPKSSPSTSQPAKAPSLSSEQSMSSRPVSRRTGSSPFFGGSSSLRTGRRSAGRMRTSYADSPTVPEENIIPGLEETILRGMREMDEIEHQGQSRDSLGITYGRAREGTRQLRSFLEGKLHRSLTKGSLQSVDSRDSRFASAPESMLDLGSSAYQQRLQGENRSVKRNVAEAQTIGDSFDNYTIDGVEDAYSEDSWETNHTTRDSQGNILEYAPNDPPSRLSSQRVSSREARESFVGVDGGGGLMGNPVVASDRTQERMDFGPDARMIPGALRRPVSVVGANRKRSSRVLVEGEGTGRRRDHKAYI